MLRVDSTWAFCRRYALLSTWTCLSGRRMWHWTLDLLQSHSLTVRLATTSVNTASFISVTLLATATTVVRQKPSTGSLLSILHLIMLNLLFIWKNIDWIVNIYPKPARTSNKNWWLYCCLLGCLFWSIWGTIVVWYPLYFNRVEPEKKEMLQNGIAKWNSNISMYYYLH